VTTPAGTWGYLAGPALFLAVTIPLFHTIGWLGISATSLVGGWAGEALARRRVARKAAARGEGVTVIPLELITGIQARKPTKAAGWLGLRSITVTAGGTEYEFRGTTEKWMAHLTAALTEYGREVHTAAESITVLPWATLEEGLRCGRPERDLAALNRRPPHSPGRTVTGSMFRRSGPSRLNVPLIRLLSGEGASGRREPGPRVFPPAPPGMGRPAASACHTDQPRDNHRAATSPWPEPPRCHIVVVGSTARAVPGRYRTPPVSWVRRRVRGCSGGSGRPGRSRRA
jgi:hypothetical protein